MDESDAETDRQKFVRLAQARVKKAIGTIRLIGNLSNTANYDWNARDVEKIFATLTAELEECRKRFDAKQKSELVFTLDDGETYG